MIEIPVFSFILIAIVAFLIIFLVVSKKCSSVEDIFFILFVATIITKLYIGVGYFIKINDFDIQYDEVLSFATFFVGFFVVIKNGLRKNIAFWHLVFLGSCIIGLIGLVFFPIKFEVLQYGSSWDMYYRGLASKELPSFSFKSIEIFVRIPIYLVIIQAFLIIENGDKFKIVLKCVYYSSFFILLILFVEMLFTLGNSNMFRSSINSIFGISKATYENIQFRGSFATLYGLMKEPSHLATSLFFSFIMVITLQRKSVIWYLNLILHIAFLLLSMSLSTILFLIFIAFVVLYWAYKCINDFSKKMLITLGIILVTLLAIIVFNKYNLGDYYINRLDYVFKSLYMDVNYYGSIEGISELSRISSIKESFKIFFNRPLFGVGLGVSDSHSITANVLANIGIVGFASWLMVLNPYKEKISFFNILILVLFIFVGTLGYMYSEVFFLVYFCLNKNFCFERKVVYECAFN